MSLKKQRGGIGLILPEWWIHPKPYAIMNCLEGMKAIPDNAVDLLLTDPPYGINICSTGSIGGNRLAKVKDYGVCDWDKERLGKEFFIEMIRISKKQ